jgi:hypothetical protein
MWSATRFYVAVFLVCKIFRGQKNPYKIENESQFEQKPQHLQRAACFGFTYLWNSRHVPCPPWPSQLKKMNT